MKQIKKDLTKKKSREGQSDFDMRVEEFKRRDEFIDHQMPRISLVISIIFLITVVIRLVR